jgi:hypothetical protein
VELKRTKPEARGTEIFETDDGWHRSLLEEFPEELQWPLWDGIRFPFGIGVECTFYIK